MASGAPAAPSEVLSEIALIKKDGMDAVRLDFAIPVRYLSHAPAKRGSKLTIKIGFDRSQVRDTSELPLMQSLYAPEGGPLIDVVYETIAGEPQLQLNFKQEVEFSVSQVSGITSLMVLLPESIPTLQPEPPVPVSLTIPEKNAADTEIDLQAKKLLDDGRKALRSDEYKTAIQIFSAVLSMPPNKYSPSALELLGVARERNNQAAQAKAIYEQYLEQYTEIEGAGEGVVRVRQRLAELLAAQLKPQQKLKESPREKREGKVNSTFAASLSQYFDYSDTETETDGRDVRYQSVDTQLGLSWRIRTEDWEVYNYYFGYVEYDTLAEDTEGVETNSAYSRIKNRKAGFYATLGRQLGSAAGALGRFDGVYLGYDIKPKIRLNGVWGYPVDILNKRSIQTNKPMIGAGVDFFDIFKGLDVSPYYIQQQVDGITARRAVGAEARYFHPKYNMFSRLDYDTSFAAVNMFFLQGQYVVSKPTSFSLTYDYRKIPFLETSNALANLGEEVSIKDLLEGSQSRSYEESELRDIAKDRTGFFSILTLQISHIFNIRQQITADISRSEQTVKVVNLAVNDPTVDEILATPATEDNNVQYDATVQLVSNQLFQSKDTLINFLRYSYGETYDETTYRLAYSIAIRSLLNVEPRFLFRYRSNDTGENLVRSVPGLRVNYQAAKALRFFMELDYEMWDFSGETQQEDFNSTNFYVGYNWNF